MRSKTWDIAGISSVAMDPALTSLLPAEGTKTRLSGRLSYRRLEDALKFFREATAVAVEEAVRGQQNSAYLQFGTQTSSTGNTKPVDCFDMYIGGRLN